MIRHSVVLLLLLGCDGSDTGKLPPEEADADTDVDLDTERTLANCGGDVAADVPSFFSEYFYCSDLSMDGGDIVIHTEDLPPPSDLLLRRGKP